MKELTKKDLLKKVARTLKKRDVDRIYLDINPFSNGVFTKVIEFTNCDTLRLTYIDNDLYSYHFITSDYNDNAYFYNIIKDKYIKAY